MKRYAIIKDSVVINVVEYEDQPIGTPLGFSEGSIAIENNHASVGWVYVNGLFTDPNPHKNIVLSESISQ